MSKDYPKRARFGRYGGQFIPETLVPAVKELERSYLAVRNDPGFKAELAHLLADYAGRPTPLYLATNLSPLVPIRLLLKSR